MFEPSASAESIPQIHSRTKEFCRQATVQVAGTVEINIKNGFCVVFVAAQNLLLQYWYSMKYNTSTSLQRFPFFHFIDHRVRALKNMNLDHSNGT
jgi:hypothetical protein